MDQQIIKEFNSFENSLKFKINGSLVLYGSNYCYLIKENWYNKINNLINCKKNNQLDGNKDNIILLTLQNEQPEFLDDISSVLDCLGNKIKIKLISIKLLELIYDENILNAHNQISFNSGNNKIIIEYKERPDNALLLLNPLENISKILLITTINQLNLVNERNKLYKELLNKEKLDLDKIYNKYNQIIINYKDYTDIDSNQIIKKNIEYNCIKIKKDMRPKKTKKN